MPNEQKQRPMSDQSSQPSADERPAGAVKGQAGGGVDEGLKTLYG